MRRSLPAQVVLAGLASLCLGACSSRQLYAVGPQWQRSACQQIEDRAERTRCEHSAAQSFEDYKAQAAAHDKP